MLLKKITQNSAKGDQNAKKVTIKSVTFTYQGTEDDFLVFLNAIVRDYLTAKENLQSGIYDKVYTSEVFKAIIQLCNPENTVSMPAGTKVLRARIIKNTDDIYREKNGIHFDGDILRGYDWFNSKEPPVGISSEGRANSRYSSYFYCADNGPTAASEIKPNIGDYISLASFEIKQDLRLIRLAEKKIDGIGEMQDRYQNIIARHFSAPVSNSHEYYLTQFISDEIRKLGVDGICYQSHFTNGNNYVIFNCPMRTIEFVNSKIIQLQSQQLNFIDFSSLTTLSTNAVPNLDEKEIEHERHYIYGMIEGYKQETELDDSDEEED